MLSRRSMNLTALMPQALLSSDLIHTVTAAASSAGLVDLLRSPDKAALAQSAWPALRQGLGSGAVTLTVTCAALFCREKVGLEVLAVAGGDTAFWAAGRLLLPHGSPQGTLMDAVEASALGLTAGLVVFQAIEGCPNWLSANMHLVGCVGLAVAVGVGSGWSLL